MPANTTHQDYDKIIPEWQKIRTAIAGEEAIKEAGTKYLPMLTGQADWEYQAYKERAMFYGASDRTVKGLTGAIFRKPPEIRFPEESKKLLETIGRAKEPIEEVAKRVVENAVGVGRVGVLLDAPQIEGADPFLAIYEAESIINWFSVLGPEGEEPIEIVLTEKQYKRSEEDRFVTKSSNLFRVLRLGFPEPDSGVSLSELEQGAVYSQELWEEVTELEDGKETTSLFLLGTIVPRMRGGKVLRRIPFWVINSSGIGLKPEKSPMLDLVSVNISHYRNSADLEHGRHFTALPTAWVAGFDPSVSLTIGASRAWVTENTQARAGFLEFTGAGLGHLQEGMTAKEKLMAILGARMLEELPVGAEAAETVRLRQSGEASTLAGIAMTCSSGLTMALRAFAEWMAIPSDEVSIALNRDFQTAGLPPNILQNLILSTQKGLTSWNTFFYNLKRGELIPDHIEEKEELALIQKGAPVFVVKSTEPAVEPDKTT